MWKISSCIWIISCVLMASLGVIAAGIKAYKRTNVNISQKRTAGYFDFLRCAGFEHFDATPPSPTCPDDSDKIRMEESHSWLFRTNIGQPDPIFTDDTAPGYLIICFEKGKKLRVDLTRDPNDYLFYLADLNATSADSDDFSFSWELQSSRLSSKTGAYIFDVTVLLYHPVICCHVSMIDYTLTILQENCFKHSNGCNRNSPPTKPLLSFHSVKFVTRADDDDLGWEGLFTLCGDNDCETRVVSVEVNGETLKLLPVFMGSGYTGHIP